MWLARALGKDTTLLQTLKKNSPTLLEVAQDLMLATVTWILFASMNKEMNKWGSRFVGD